MRTNTFSLLLNESFYCQAFTRRQDAINFADQLRKEHKEEQRTGTVLVQRRTVQIKDGHGNNQKTTIWFVVA